MRKCRRQSCRSPLPTAKLSDKWQEKGFCSCDCMAGHGMDKAKTIRERQHKIETKTRRDNIKSKTQWLNEAQAAFNSYVRLRDRGKPCVSCGKPDNGTHQRHASHYRSVGACSSLRFNLKNVYASCQQCNTSKSGNLLEYRIRLKARYGESLVEWLESQNEPKRYETDYLIRLRDVFRKRVNQLKKRQP